MHQCFGLPGIRVLGSQLGELDTQAGMLGDMDVGWKIGGHAGIRLTEPIGLRARACDYVQDISKDVWAEHSIRSDAGIRVRHPTASTRSGASEGSSL